MWEAYVCHLCPAAEYYRLTYVYYIYQLLAFTTESNKFTRNNSHTSNYCIIYNSIDRRMYNLSEHTPLDIMHDWL